jgi:predicted DsbA family dithiol-disulfide isomerase
MTSSAKNIAVDYFSDLLCVWAWIAQPRLEELEKQWGNEITLRHHFVDIFGDCHQKIPDKWGLDDGFEKFGDHVQQSAEPFELAKVSPHVWHNVQPRSSGQAHLVLRAAGLTNRAQQLPALAKRFREAFFCEAQDISDQDVLLALAQELGFNADELLGKLQDGSAIAAYSTDLRRSSELGVRGSPTWILNSGRQVLYGNVGYRILSANIEELLSHPTEEASWC